LSTRIEVELAIAYTLEHGDGMVLGTEINSIILAVMQSKTIDIKNSKLRNYALQRN
jgi:hypothetical protein